MRDLKGLTKAEFQKRKQQRQEKRNRMAGEAVVGTPAGDAISQSKISKDLIDPVTGKRDYSIANWDDPSKKEQKKFKKATGYSQYLGGFREDFIEDMYKDQRIDWYANDNSYNKIFKNLGKHTGLNFNRVQDQDQAEILNFNERGEAFTLPRTDKDLTNNLSGYDATMVTSHEAFGPVKGKGSRLEGAAGISTPWNVKQYGSFIPTLSEFDDRFQTNRTVAFTGDEVKKFNYAAPFKGAEAGYLGGDYKKQAKQMNQHTRAHEVGHSLGIEGDLTLSKKDPSLMSYNTSIRSGRLGTREYESIKRNFAPYINPDAYVPYVPPVTTEPIYTPTAGV